MLEPELSNNFWLGMPTVLIWNSLVYLIDFRIMIFFSPMVLDVIHSESHVIYSFWRMSSASLQILGSFEKLLRFWVQSDTESQLSLDQLKRILDDTLWFRIFWFGVISISVTNVRAVIEVSFDSNGKLLPSPRCY